jgi:curved DNA-binding protein CbpA
MSTKSPYEILGVPRDATPDQIRRAYLLKVKQSHPDNFDQVKQRARWEQANEQLKELNEAYSILKNQDTRAHHDSGAASAAPPPRRQRSPDWDIKLGKLKAGMAWFASLPKSIQDRILERTTGREKNQFSIELGGIGWNYFFVLLLSAWLWVLANNGNSAGGWRQQDQAVMFLGTLACALLQGWNICHIIKWRLSPLRPHLIITPLYVIKTSAEQVWFWPIWSVTSVRATHNYRNSSYTDTDLYMEFGSDHQSFKLSPEAAYAQLCAMMDIFGRRVNAAKAQDDLRYFYAEDDFREFDPDAPAVEPPTPTRRIRKVLALTAAVYFAFYLGGLLINRQAARETVAIPSSRYEAPARPYVAPTPAFVAPSYPEQVMPENGSNWTYGNSEQVARFVVAADAVDHHWIKLVDASSGAPVMAIFVRAGSKAEIKVPLGTYVIKYASGRKWYGASYLFGPDTTYSKAPNPVRFYVEGNIIHGYSITLYKVSNGNLRTERITASEF